MGNLDQFTPRLTVAVLIILLCFGYFFTVTLFTLPKTGEDIAKIIVPFLLGSGIGTLIGFYWGNKAEEKKTPPDSTNTTTETTAKTTTTEETTQPVEPVKTEVKPNVQPVLPKK